MPFAASRACVLLLVCVLIGARQEQATSAQTAGANTDLIEAVKAGELARARELLTHGMSVHAGDRRGFTPLLWAAATGNVVLVRQLLDSGAAVDQQARDGTTPLLLAAANGFTEVVRALVSRGANVMAKRNGMTARQVAVDRGHPGAAVLLEQAEALGGRLIEAATQGHDSLVRQLLAMGAPFNTTDERGATALMIAARNGDLGILQALLSRGADSSVRDTQGRTVLEWIDPAAATSRYVIAFLVDRGVPQDVARSSQPAPSPQVKASLATLASILGRVPPASGDVRAAQRRANTALSQLESLSAKWPAESPDDYRDNLAAEIAALEAAIAAGDATGLADTLRSVADDLEIKLEHCTRSGGRLGGSVRVRVRTVRGGEESTSWQVFYMPRVFEAAASASPDLFPHLSSPTEEAIVPGRYVMWVRDPVTTRLGERTVVKIGEGRSELLLDLPVPASPPR